MSQLTKPGYSFVNLTHPHGLKDEDIQLRVRRLAMAEVGKARRKPKMRRERNKIVLELHKSTEEIPVIERFGGGRMDPFSPFPIRLDDSARELLAGSRYIFYTI
jgi:hypothetical protein